VEIIPDKRRVVGLVETALDGKVCLPNFQRDFVWARDEVADLVRSILRQYFIGSLLLLRCEPQNPPFDPVFLRGADPTNAKPQPELLILDGQQRLTSLLYALNAPDLSLKNSVQRRWFFVDIEKLLADPDDDEIVFDRAKRELDGLDKVERQYELRILPCTRLLNADAFYQWRDGLEDWLRDFDPDGLKDFRGRWRTPLTEAVSAFQNFEVPLVELPTVRDDGGEDIGRVCAIFEKLNSTGVELSVYDLLTARLYRSGIRLHDLWDETCARHARINRWSAGKADKNKFGVLLLRTLALLRGLDPKPRILIDLAPAAFETDWRRAASAMERSLELIERVGPDGFGVFDAKWLPYYGLLPILAALRAEVEDRKLGEGPRRDLQRWYWCNVFLERYSSAVETKSRRDFAEFLRWWTEDGPEPSVFAEARVRIGAGAFTIRESASYASAIYSGVFCLLALRNARDWKYGEAIELQSLEDHHIFPRRYLRDHGVAQLPRVNSIVNRTLISDQTNRIIGGRAPSEYIDDASVFPAGASGALLEPHFLGEPSIVLMRDAREGLTNDAVADVYEHFRAIREAAVVTEIRRVCDLAEDE